MTYYLKYDNIELKPVCFSVPDLYSHWEYKIELCFVCHLSSLSQCLLYVPTGLALKNSTVCPQSVFTFMCGSQHKQPLFSCKALTDLVFITPR